MKILPLLALLCGVGCIQAGGPFDDEADQDGDGVPQARDCDDYDPLIRPGIAEDCDGVDQDCDGLIDEGAEIAWFPDRDGDGFGTGAGHDAACLPTEGWSPRGDDCDDGDAAIHPDGVETCDGRDNDCDDTVDEDLLSPWFPDQDGDGIGAGWPSVVRCTQPEGYVDTAGDCNDVDPDVHPGQREVCDEGDQDEDCDGVADDADPKATRKAPWYRDDDLDTYGVADDLIFACDRSGAYLTGTPGDCDDSNAMWYPLPIFADLDGDFYGAGPVIGHGCGDVPNTALRGGDCDDGDAAAHPGGTELWYDGRDGDCDGADDYDADGDGEVLLSAGGLDCDDTDAAIFGGAGEILDDEVDNNCDGLQLQTALVIRGVATDDRLGAAMASTPDLDGEGHPGLAIGGPGWDGGALDGGGVWLFGGEALAGLFHPSAMQADAIISGAGAGDQAGAAVQFLDDLDGDGLVDVLVGAPYNMDAGYYAGKVSLLFGPLSGALSTADADVWVTSSAATNIVGRALASVQDLDGDGLQDAWLGGWAASDPAVCLHTSAVLAEGTDVAFEDGAFCVTGDGTSTLGSVIDAGGDLDGDGLVETALGVPWPGTSDVTTSRVLVLNGDTVMSNTSLAADDADWILTSGHKDDAGSALVLADLNGDGLADLVVGDPQSASTSGGTLALFDTYGEGSALSDASTLWEAAATVAQAGHRLLATDLDADGQVDLSMAFTGAAAAGLGAGAWWTAGPVADGTYTISPEDNLIGVADAALGFADAYTAQDWSGDGLNDLLFGLPGADGGTTGSGAAWGVLGGQW